MKRQIWKCFFLLLLAALILLSVPFACADRTPAGKAAPELFDLWDCEGESMTWIASAVPVYEGMLIVSPSLLPEKTDNLAVTDGVNTWQAEAVLPDSDGLLAMVLFDREEKTAAAGPWELMSAGRSVPASDCIVRYADAMQSRINRAVLASESIAWRERSALLLTLAEQVPAGSPVLTGDGQLAGIVVAEWAEGKNRAVALPPEEIYSFLLETLDKLSFLPDWTDAPEGFTVTMKKNKVTFDWSGMDLPDPPEGEKWYLVFTDTGNSYLTYYPVEKRHSFTEVLTPGRFYAAGMMACADTPDAMPEKLVFFLVPQAERLTKYQFTPVETAIAESTDGKTPVPVAEVTRELLRSDRAYFYSHSTYNVIGTFGDLSLLVTITDPNGMNHRYESSWIYSPDYMKKDIWYTSLKEMGLTELLDLSGYPDGVYTVAYYVDGDLADSFEFTLEKGD